ncbi:hypothetical protein TRFO_30896 [Tritrichomonas foetus]|uniref:Ribosome biogenesis regulatory protein n=1 Tax=Tritrichomonas foetus TaxID=1144522 RepID=A0A1J4JX72_9EUKA|nr:hypothetical protein TRFO_30896 [Tritrichomonas foetus]|eukprot:OHT02134.1 hypothetical protein TRFO_30896 [Tritrichomonas foetus]
MSEITFDIAHATVLDPNHYTSEQVADESFLLNQASLSFNNLFSQIKALPHDTNNRLVLPKPVIQLPRENHIPIEEPKTRWEQFKLNKGIKTQKKDKKVFDEASGEWRLRYGYKRGNKPVKDWLIEVPNGVYEDPFEKRDKKKKESVNEQLKRERRNKKRAERAKIDSMATSVTSRGNYKTDQIKDALKVASYPGSSASMNQFNKLPNKPTIYEEGSKIPKIIDRNVGKNKKGK